MPNARNAANPSVQVRLSQIGIGCNRRRNSLRHERGAKPIRPKAAITGKTIIPSGLYSNARGKFPRTKFDPQRVMPHPGHGAPVNRLRMHKSKPSPSGGMTMAAAQKIAHMRRFRSLNRKATAAEDFLERTAIFKWTVQRSFQPRLTSRGKYPLQSPV